MQAFILFGWYGFCPSMLFLVLGALLHSQLSLFIFHFFFFSDSFIFVIFVLFGLFFSFFFFWIAIFTLTFWSIQHISWKLCCLDVCICKIIHWGFSSWRVEYNMVGVYRKSSFSFAALWKNIWKNGNNSKYASNNLKQNKPAQK